MTTHLAAAAGTQPPTRSEARPLGQLLPGAAGLLYAGIQLDGGIIAAAYRGTSTVPDDRLNFPFSGSLATSNVADLGPVPGLVRPHPPRVRAQRGRRSEPSRPHRRLCSRSWAASCSLPRMR